MAVSPFAVGRPGLNEIEGRRVSPLGWMPFAFPFNLTGHPAVSVPCGLDPSGLPVGLQIVAGWHRDELAVTAAARFEELQPWPRHPPGFAA